MFTGEKIAQMAAFFTSQEGGDIYVLKLMKLLYLADRESIDRYGVPISYDRMISMDHGPVLSSALNLTNGFLTGPAAEQWDAWISDRADHRVSLLRDATRGNLDHLSDADIEVLEVVWDNFGQMTRYEIRDYTHRELGEWRDPRDRQVVLRVSVWLSLETAPPKLTASGDRRNMCVYFSLFAYVLGYCF